MYGKHFASMYEGSMIGAGAVVFAVMGYVIAKQVPDRSVGSQVRLNPKLLSTILGENENQIVKAIEYLCSPDDGSTTKAEQGRRLIKIGEFDYQVVNGAKYRAIRDEEARREQNRVAQQKHREKVSGKPSRGWVGQPRNATRVMMDTKERQFLKAEANGDTKEADRISAENLPSGKFGTDHGLTPENV